METAEYEKMYNLEDTYWWFQGRMKIILNCLEAHGLPQPGSRILDVGCGTGLMLKRLERFDPVGLDYSPLAMRFCRRRGAQRLVCADVTRLPFEDGAFDLILALDLLEHVERDDRLVEEFHRALRPGGHAIITVPAHQWLWSEHDEALHHYRRYSAAQLRGLFETRGFSFPKFTYAITFTFLPIVAFRWLQRMWKRGGATNSRPKTHLIRLPQAANAALIRALEIEAWWLRRHNLPQGVSLLALARKEA